MDISRMIFVTGFTRGGTTWLRDCIATHPDIDKISRELVVFREYSSRESIEQALAEAVAEGGRRASFWVEKSPANAPYLDIAVRMCPEAKFLFVIRDPRDAFCSHKRGTFAWMRGKNSTVEGCLNKLRTYYKGYERSRTNSNLFLVRYEDLHQDFFDTMRKVFFFIGVESNDSILKACWDDNNFWKVATRHRERRDESRRKGVVGDWVNHLSEKEGNWIQHDQFWPGFLKEYGYDWGHLSYEKLLKAMKGGGVRFLTEDDLLHQNLDDSCVNALILHDIDRLNPGGSEKSVLATAELESRSDIPAIYYFLPFDDSRYRKMDESGILRLMRKLIEINSEAHIGFHLNAAEKFFPPELPDLGNDHIDITKAVRALHNQMDAFERKGIQLRTATAHGYGRRKKRPNNRDTPQFSTELRKRGVFLWDTDLAPRIYSFASRVFHLTDLGGALTVWGMPDGRSAFDSRSYLSMPSKSLIRILIHPGNYDIDRPLTLGLRANSL
jgi:hypothetical protein